MNFILNLKKIIVITLGGAALLVPTYWMAHENIGVLFLAKF